MPKIKEHFYLRYCQRVLNMTEADSEIKQYINQHRDKLTREINSFFNESIYFWSGELGDKHCRSFYIKDNFYLVCSKDHENLITVIKINFDFPEEILQVTINGFIEAIQKINKEIDQSRQKAKEIVNKKDIELEILNREIALKQEELNSLKGKRNVLEAEKNVAYNESSQLAIKATKYAVQLFYSDDYKRDISISGNGNGK